MTLEGIDGSGKSTQARLLADALERAGHEVVRTREPGGTALGEAIREIVLAGDVPVSDTGEAFLFAAARAQLVVEVIAPALAAGHWVVCDRFVDSSLAYQGGGRGAGIARVEEINALAVGDAVPDMTLLLEIDPARAAARRAGGGDRIESEGIALQERVAAAYAEIAGIHSDRLRRINADRPPDEVHAEIIALMETLP